MADSEERQKFEARVLETIKYAKREDFVIGEYGYNNPNLQEWFRWFEAGMRAGEIAMREKAVKVARDEGDAPGEDGGNCARQDACDNVARAIRALAISGAEESTPAELP